MDGREAMPSPYYSASVVLFELHGGMVSHMLVLTTPFSTVHNTFFLAIDPYSRRQYKVSVSYRLLTVPYF